MPPSSVFTFFNAHGPEGIERMGDLGAPIFADLKFHDIPNTVAGAVRSIMRARPFMLNVHTSGGPAMMKAARAAMDEMPESERALLIGVTILTSMIGIFPAVPILVGLITAMLLSILSLWFIGTIPQRIREWRKNRATP